MVCAFYQSSVLLRTRRVEDTFILNRVRKHVEEVFNQPQSQGGMTSDVLGFNLGLFRHTVHRISSPGAQSEAWCGTFAPHERGPAPSSALHCSTVEKRTIQ